MKIYQYWREQLPPCLQQGYDVFLRSNLRTRQVIPSPIDDMSQIMKCLEHFSYDHPEMYYLPFNLQYTTKYIPSFFGNKITSVSVNYTPLYSDFEQREYDALLSDIFSRFDRKISMMTNDVDRERCVIDTVLEGASYLINPPDTCNLVGVFFNKHTQCEGVAKACKHLFDRANMKSIFISGVMEGEAHAWNLVFINDAWYHLDVTGMLNTGHFDPMYTYNLDDERVRRKYTWDHNFYPACASIFTMDGKNVNSGIRTNTGVNDIPIVTNLFSLRLLLNEAIQNRKKTFSFSLAIAGKDGQALVKIGQETIAAEIHKKEYRVGYHLSVSYSTAGATFEYDFTY